MAAIGKDNIALDKKKQSALMKSVKRVKKEKEKGSSAKKTVERSTRGIIMLEHVPHGFYEDEMKKYFSQFGKVRRVRVARSQKTGKSRGYAYVEFEFREVAQIAAEAMNNYLMFERLIKCKLLPLETKPRKIFRDKYITEKKNPKLLARKARIAAEDKVLTEEETKSILQQRLDKVAEQNKKFAEMGINYHFQIKTKAGDDDVKPDIVPGKEEEDHIDFDEPKSEEESSSAEEEDEGVGVDIADEENCDDDEEDDDEGLSSDEEEEQIINAPIFSKSPQNKQGSIFTEKKKTPESFKAKYSPKLLRSRKSVGPGPIPQTPGGKEKISNLPRISPKMLRSRKSEAPASVASSTPKEKPKFSPKLLRSRKNEVPSSFQSSKEVKNKTPAKGKARTDLPKISPKMLRSRKSEAPSSLTPMKVATTSKQKKGGRKSVI